MFHSAERLMAAGEYSKAISKFKKIKAFYNNAIVLYNIALCYQNHRKFKEAIQKYKTALNINPHLAPAFNNLSLCYQNLSEFKEAKTAQEKALSLAPSNQIYLINLCKIYFQLNMFQEINAQISDHSDLDLNDEDTLEFLGDFYQKIKKADTAADFYLKAFKISNHQRTLKKFSLCCMENGIFSIFIDQKKKGVCNWQIPEWVSANIFCSWYLNRNSQKIVEEISNNIKLLSEASAIEAIKSFTNFNMFDEALSVSQLILDDFPTELTAGQHIEALINLYINTKKISAIECEVLIEKFFKKNNYPIIRDLNLSRLAYLTGDFAQAYQTRKRLYLQDKKNVELAKLYINSAISVGKTEELTVLIEELIMQKKASADLIFQYSELKGGEIPKPIDTIIQNLLNSDLKKEQSSLLKFSAFNIEHKKENFQKAFKFLKQANDDRFDLLKHSLEADFEHIDRCSAYLNRENPYLPPAFDETFNPIFIVGLPRSGTTLLERIITNNDQVYSLGEDKTILPLLLKFGCVYNDISHSDKQDIHLEYRNITKPDLSTRKRLRTLDKMPLNFMYLHQLINLIGGKVIHIYKNSKDAVWSNYKKSFAETGMAYTYNFEQMMEFHRKYRKYMQVAQELHLPILHVKYEDLICDPIRTVHKVSKYLDLELSHTSVDLIPEQYGSRTASNLQVRGAISKKYIGQWLKYSNFLPSKFLQLEDLNLLDSMEF